MGRRAQQVRGRPAALLVAVAVVLVVMAAGCTDPSDEATPSTAAPTPSTTTVGTTTVGTTTTPPITATTVASTTAPTSTTTPPADGSPEALLAGLTVRTLDPAAPYRRDAFGDDWDYDPASGCNTREQVLIEESLIEPQVDDRCRTTLGRWRSAYDGIETDDPADLQIDHFVPLADAWRSGANTWTDERRRSFANDRTSPDTLIAVTGSTNQSKGDSTPDEWLPPDESSWCTYAESWIRVKSTWQLSVTTPERARLADLLTTC